MQLHPPVQDMAVTAADLARHTLIRTHLQERFVADAEQRDATAESRRAEYRVWDDRWRKHCEMLQRASKQRKSGRSSGATGEGRPTGAPKRSGGGALNHSTSSRSASRRSAGFGDAARSEAEFLAILASLESADMRDPTMRATRTAAHVPDLAEQRQADYAVLVMDENCTRVELPEAFFRTEAAANSQAWTDDEIRTYCRRFALHPKAFGRIASALPGRSIAACVAFYYGNKHRIDFRGLLDKRARRRTRGLKKGGSSLLANLMRPDRPDDLEDDEQPGDDATWRGGLADIPLRREARVALTRQTSVKRSAKAESAKVEGLTFGIDDLQAGQGRSTAESHALPAAVRPRASVEMYAGWTGCY
jgi:hypothetical protein